MVSTKSMYNPDPFVCSAYDGLDLNACEKAQYSSALIVDESYYNVTTSNNHHPVVTSDCPKCSSNLPLKETDDKGTCKCEFCGKEVYVW